MADKMPGLSRLKVGAQVHFTTVGWAQWHVEITELVLSPDQSWCFLRGLAKKDGSDSEAEVAASFNPQSRRGGSLTGYDLEGEVRS